MKDIKKSIHEIVCKYINNEINDNDPLIEMGIDSMNLLFIVNDIEKVFSITIPDEKLLINNFETINNIYDLIMSILEEW